jgi:putative transposase
VFCKINGQWVYLWHAMDRDRQTLDVLVQKQRSAKAPKLFIRKLLEGLCYVPRVLVTDKLGSYAVAREELMPAVEHCRGGRANIRARVISSTHAERERRVRRFKSMRHTQRFLSVHAVVSNHLRPCRHRLRAAHYREVIHRCFAEWQSITGTEMEMVTPAN